MNPNFYVAIMAGGVGSRFWPASREARPKQFLDILGTGKTLLQMTYDRFLPLIAPENILVVTNKAYVDLVKEQLPSVLPQNILAEPSRNNTAPCLAYTALKLENMNPAATFVVASSDHLIVNEAEFLKNIEAALVFAEKKDALMTLGITPNSPNTGYGYIQYNRHDANNDGIFKVKSFTEKPNLEKAKEFLVAGNYVWNAGIFVWQAKALLKSFEKYAGDILTLLEGGIKKYNTPEEQSFIDEIYPQTRNESIDFAIMEVADNVYTIPCEFGWSDLGAWGALHDESVKDADGNAIQAGKTFISEVTNSLVRISDPKKLVVLRGVSDFIVVDEDDVLLIYPREKEQDIKRETALIKQTIGTSYL